MLQLLNGEYPSKPGTQEIRTLCGLRLWMLTSAGGDGRAAKQTQRDCKPQEAKRPDMSRPSLFPSLRFEKSNTSFEEEPPYT